MQRLLPISSFGNAKRANSEAFCTEVAIGLIESQPPGQMTRDATSLFVRAQVGWLVRTGLPARTEKVLFAQAEGAPYGVR
jgi:hypothetical protein